MRINFNSKKTLINKALELINAVVSDKLTTQKLKVLEYIMLNGNSCLISRSDEKKLMIEKLNIANSRMSLIIKDLHKHGFLVNNIMSETLKDMVGLVNDVGEISLNFKLVWKKK